MEESYLKQLKHLQLQQMVFTKDKEQIQLERTEFSRFLRFLVKVSTKLRKHILKLPPGKNIRGHSIAQDTQELKFQYKVLVDRLLQRHTQLREARADPLAYELVQDIKSACRSQDRTDGDDLKSRV